MKTYKVLIGLLIAVLGFFLVMVTRVEEKTTYYDLQINATKKMQEAIDSIKEKRLELGIPIDSSIDPLETGLIGIDAGIDGPSITTTLGHLDAKRTSTNPNFAGLIVGYLADLGVKKKDYVTLNFSGSFPALNIAAIIACDMMELETTIHSSIGSSMYGANIVDFTYIDMEKHLFDKGIIKNKSSLVSLGGENDLLDSELNTGQFISSLIERYQSDYDFLLEGNLSNNVSYRFNDYKKEGKTSKAFINVGGNIAAFGKHGTNYPNGLTKRFSVNVSSNSGLIDLFLRDDVPLIHLLNIVDLANKNGMVIDSKTPYEIGVGSMYYTYSYQWIIVIVTIVSIFGYLSVNKYLVQKEKNSERNMYEQKTNWNI